jgi:hypothetical protein
MWDGMAIQPLRSIPDYGRLVEGAGLKVLSITDLTNEWGPILKDRLAMYQTLREEARQAGTPLGHDAFHESYIRLSNSFNSANSAALELSRRNS